MSNTFEMHLEARLTAIQGIENSHAEIIERAVAELIRTFKNQGRLFICGKSHKKHGLGAWWNSAPWQGV